MNSESNMQFWRLLSDYEALTRQESVAILHEDIPSLIEAQRLKATIFPVMDQLGARLGLHRSICPELNTRLEGISTLEQDNLRALETAREAAQRRISELAGIRQRLQQVRRNYREEQPAGFAGLGFVAHG